jgi:hypothetical protein|tara:strand:- start:248 stop:481 length:234 start_codon:yes stop_codon:yes gene_type:complete
MDVLGKLSGWIGSITQATLGLLCLAVVLQILFGAPVPFFPVDVIGSITGIVGKLGGQGLVGLAALLILVGLFNRNNS